jgi:predicted O-methyltransferase YrrM
MNDVDPILELQAKAPYEYHILKPVLHPSDWGLDFVVRGTYRVYYSVGQYFVPTTILEIGTRYGYSLHAMAAGSARPVRAYSYDVEEDRGSSEWTKNHLGPDVSFRYTVADTRLISGLELPEPIDLAHVDGDHSEQGCYEDLCLVHPHIRSGGVILVDDVGESDNFGGPRAAAMVFCREHKLTPQYLPSYRGMFLIRVPPVKK